MNNQNPTFRIVYQAKDLAEFRALMAEFPSLANQSYVSAPMIARAASPSVFAGGEERKLRDAFASANGKNFSFKKFMRANYPAPIDALRAWKGHYDGTSGEGEGKASAAMRFWGQALGGDMDSGGESANDSAEQANGTGRDTSDDDTDEVLD